MKTTFRNAFVVGSALSLLVGMQIFAQKTQPTKDRNLTQRTAGQHKFCLASKVEGMTVKDKANQEVGKIQDLLIDQSGQVQYLAIATQGQQDPTERNAATNNATERNVARGNAAGRNAADKNAKLTLVPFEAAQFHDGQIQSQNYVTLNLDKDRLMQAPSFTAQQLAAQGQQSQWMSQVDQFFNREGGASARPNLNRDQDRIKKPEEDK